MVTIVLVLDQNDFNLGSGVARLQSTGRRSTQGSRFEEICLPFSSCNFNCRIASTRKVYREERIRDQSSIEEYKGAEGGRGGKRIERFFIYKAIPLPSPSCSTSNFYTSNSVGICTLKPCGGGGGYRILWGIGVV